jgi:hypothetical protein
LKEFCRKVTSGFIEEVREVWLLGDDSGYRPMKTDQNLKISGFLDENFQIG